MNGKFEERLARLAFGDLTPEEARKLEQDAVGNPEASRVLMEYQAMRDGLRGLGADVPADQMSKERLRDAILGQGLRPAPAEPARNGLTWLWMPTVACAIAFGIFTVRNNMPTSAEPMLVMDQTKKAGFDAKLLEPSTTVAALAPVKKTTVEPTTEPKAMTVAKADTEEQPRKRRSRNRKPVILYASNFPDRNDDAVEGNVTPSKDEIPTVTKQEEKASEPVATLASAPIVLIDTGNKNELTGASTATEVGTANDVLVGG